MGLQKQNKEISSIHDQINSEMEKLILILNAEESGLAHRTGRDWNLTSERVNKLTSAIGDIKEALIELRSI